MGHPLNDEGLFRAATAEVSGYRADTDDVVAALELIEEDINPADGGRKAKRDPTPGGMMPPMMGGAQGAADAGRQAARASQTTLGGASATPGVTPGVAGGGVSAPGGFGSGSASLGSVGAVGASGTIAAGGGPDQGFGINPATGRPWSPGDPGFIERFGVRDPSTGVYHNPYTGMSYDPATGLWTRAGTGAVAGSGGSGGSGAVSSQPVGGSPVDGGGASDPAAGGANGSADSTAAGASRAPSPAVPTAGSGGTGGAPPPGGAGSGFQVEPAELDTASTKWNDMSSGMSQIAQRIGDVAAAVQFGMVVHPIAAYTSASGAAQTQTGQVSSVYQDSSTKMRQTSADYGDTETQNAFTARLPEEP